MFDLQDQRGQSQPPGGQRLERRWAATMASAGLYHGQCRGGRSGERQVRIPRVLRLRLRATRHPATTGRRRLEIPRSPGRFHRTHNAAIDSRRRRKGPTKMEPTHLYPRFAQPSVRQLCSRMNVNPQHLHCVAVSPVANGRAGRSQMPATHPDHAVLIHRLHKVSARD